MHPLLFFISEVIVLGLCFTFSPFFYYLSPLYPSVKKAVAVIHPTKGNTMTGTVIFTQEKDGVHIVAACKGLKPGKHGFHIHEFGDCSCDDANCAGSHFNPTNEPHGGPTSAHRHAGDFGNIEVNENGEGHMVFVDTRIALNGRNSIIGRSVIIHDKEDDLTSQPSGNAGDRIGCGNIGIAKVS